MSSSHSTSHGYPSVQDVLAIWRTSACIPYHNQEFTVKTPKSSPNSTQNQSESQDCDPLASTGLLVSVYPLLTQQTRYIKQWQVIEISSETTGRVIDVLCHAMSGQYQGSDTIELR